MMNLRAATVDDLGKLAPGAAEFYASSKFLKSFSIEKFTETWTRLFGWKTGVIFLLIEGDEILGALGGLLAPDLYSGSLIANEMFWFVRERARGGGLRLYHAFEQWARDQGSAQINMVHLMDLTPEALEKVYERLGFVLSEKHYTKELAA